jgi:hypothetical protein
VLSMLFMVVLKDCFASVLCSLFFRVSCLDERFERWRTIKCRNPDISDSWEFTNGLYLFTGIIWGILGIGIHRIPRNRSSLSVWFVCSFVCSFVRSCSGTQHLEFGIWLFTQMRCCETLNLNHTKLKALYIHFAQCDLCAIPLEMPSMF